MRELGPDRLSQDGRRLVLRDAQTGESFQVPLERLVPFLDRTDAPQPDVRAETEPTMQQTTLSPREIQTRVRRGESPEQIAEASGMELDRVEPFAAPVLAEREYMVEQARRTTIRRRHVGGSGVQLGAAVDERLADSARVPEEAAWDAWRREDGRWTVTAHPRDDAAPATFLFDVKGRYVVPADDAAHDLVGDVALPDSADMAIADAIRETVEAEAAATQDAEVVQTPSLEVEIEELVIDVVAEAEAEAHAPVSSLQEARDRKALEAEAVAEAEAQAKHAEKPAEGPHQDSLDDLFSEAEQDVAVPDTVAPRAKKKNERRRVPSWDEIMFGGRED